MTKLILTTAVALAIGTSAFAKAHDQGQTETSGANVGAETVSAAKTLGAALGNGKKPVVAGGNGKSASAGKPE